MVRLLRVSSDMLGVAADSALSVVASVPKLFGLSFGEYPESDPFAEDQDDEDSLTGDGWANETTARGRPD